MPSTGNKNFRNRVGLDQISLACRHCLEMTDAGVTENLSIRTLELFVDVYAKLHHGGSPTPHHVDQVTLWSVEALKLRRLKPELKPKDYLRVEHGTPRRGLARMVLDLYQRQVLTEENLQALAQKYWKLAVITLEEDARLNKVARSAVFSSPEERWAAAGIKFDSLDNN